MEVIKKQETIPAFLYILFVIFFTFIYVKESDCMNFPNLEPAEEILLTMETPEKCEMVEPDILSFDEDLEPEI